MMEEDWKDKRLKLQLACEEEKACKVSKKEALQIFLGKIVQRASLQVQHVVHDFIRPLISTEWKLLQVSKELLSGTAADNKVQHLLNVMGFAAARDMDFSSRSKVCKSMG